MKPESAVHQEDVEIMAERLAMLYYHFAKVAHEELGEERAIPLIKKAILSYGQECGLKVRKTVEDAGLPTEGTNYSLGKDLPSVGWKRNTTCQSGVHETAITRCPLAEYWISKGAEALGRLYCWVDQAKYDAYNPSLKCDHIKNVLNGDEICVLRIQESSRDSGDP